MEGGKGPWVVSWVKEPSIRRLRFLGKGGNL
jgi:hypothetical protein